MKKLLIVLLTSSFLVACGNGSEDGASEGDDEEVVEDVVDEEKPEEKEEAKVFIQEGPEEISIRTENIEISHLSLVSLEYDADEDLLLEDEVLKEKDNIEANQKITWEAVYSEGIPSRKLLWELANGEKGEYVIFYDGKDGLNEEEVMVFPEEEKDLDDAGNTNTENTEAYISELVEFSEEKRRVHHENLAEEGASLSEQVYEHLMLAGIHENTEKYEGRVNPGDSIRFVLPDAEKFDDRSTYEPKVSDEGYFQMNLADYEFEAGEDILVYIRNSYPEDQVFALTVHEAEEGMENIAVSE